MNCKLSNHLNRKYCFFFKDASPVTFIISSFQNSVKVTKRLFQQFSWKQANPAHFNFNESRFRALYTIIRNRLRDKKLNIKINISGKRFTKWGTDWAQSKIIQSRFYIRFNTMVVCHHQWWHRQSYHAYIWTVTDKWCFSSVLKYFLSVAALTQPGHISPLAANPPLFVTGTNNSMSLLSSSVFVCVCVEELAQPRWNAESRQH